MAWTVCVVLLEAPAGALAQSSDQVGQWGPVLNWGRQAKHAVLLATGDVLIWSTGDNASVWDTETTGSFTSVPFLTSDIHCAGQATLADGQVIVIGGVNETPHIGTPITALFDPFTNTWTNGTPMNYARWYGTATALYDGRLLASSGDDESQDRVTIPEVYDPLADTWTTLAGADRLQSLYPFMFMMPDGRVYEAGAKSSTAFLNLSGSGSWTAGPSNSFGSSGYSESCAMYGIGKILRAGGGDPAWANAAVINTTVASPAWRDISPMAFPRRRHNLVILADGNVMAVGGTRQSDDESKAVLAGEVWNPTTEKWTTVASMKEARMYHSTALLLADGRVMAGGGEATGRLHAEIYSPPYLFKGARPTISSAPASVSYGSSFTVNTPQSADIASVALLRPGAVTHTYDQNQRYIPLSFTRSGSGLLVSAPASGNVAPPGYHMLVIKNAVGVPSVAAWLRLGSTASLVPGKITGLVTNGGTGAAIGGATISYVGGSTTTATSGSYTLSSVPGEHLVTAFKTGFALSSQITTVPPGTTVTLNFALVAPGTIRGRVTDAHTGSPIAGATVSYSGGSVTTNATGDYTASVASGTQFLSASALGYQSASQTVKVPASSSVTVNFALVPQHTSIHGEVFDAVTGGGIAGATVSYSGGSTSTDAIGLYELEGPPAGLHRVSASAPGYLSASSEVSVVEGFMTTADFSLNRTGGQMVSFAPAADARVKLSNRTKNYGSDPLLRVQINEHVSYLRFDVSGVSASVQSATLSLFNSDGSDHGGDLYVVSNAWDESTIIWDNAPAIRGTPIASVGAVSTGSKVDFDVTSVVAGNGSYSFALRSPSSDTANYSSKEGSKPPSLVLVLGSVSPPPPTADFSAEPRTGEAPLSVDFKDLSMRAPTAWHWTFGDGATSEEQHPTHVYRDAGSYGVTLVVTNAGGSDTLTRQSYITVNPAEGGGPVEHHETQSGGSVASRTVKTGTHVDAMMGQLYVAAVATKPYVEVTAVSGLGLTWTKVRSQCGARGMSGVAVFVGEGRPSMSGQVSATLDREPAAATIAVSAYTGANPLDPIGNVVSGNTRGVNGVCSGGVDSAAYSFKIPVTAPGAAVYSAVAIRKRSHTPGAGYTERIEVHAGTSGGTAGLAVQDKVLGEPATVGVSGTLSTATDWAVVALEILP